MKKNLVFGLFGPWQLFGCCFFGWAYGCSLLFWSNMILVKKELWEESFEDWAKLLKTAKSEELLDDPKAVWDEAWRQAVMICIATVDQHADLTTADKLNQHILRKLLK